MAHRQNPKKRSPKHKSHPVDALFDGKIEKRVSEKEQGERKRLSPRRRLTKILFDAVEKEFALKGTNGLSMHPERRLSIIERNMKSLCRVLGLEAPAKKDKEE